MKDEGRTLRILLASSTPGGHFKYFVHAFDERARVLNKAGSHLCIVIELFAYECCFFAIVFAQFVKVLDKRVTRVDLEIHFIDIKAGGCALSLFHDPAHAWC